MARAVPPFFFRTMASFLKKVIPTWLVVVVACSATVQAAEPGFLEGHLTIYSPGGADLADGKPPSKTAKNYADYPLLVLSGDGKNEVARLTADKDGNYRVALPPGDYVLDAEGRRRGHLRVKPKPFQVVSKQAVRVDIDIDTGVR
jgi:hypothetical protein